MIRASKKQLILTFHTTAAAIATEKLCKQAGISGRLIPVPRSLTSDCGMAWCMEPDGRDALQAVIAGKDIDIAGFHELIL